MVWEVKRCFEIEGKQGERVTGSNKIYGADRDLTAGPIVGTKSVVESELE